jgi:hypothetical protein
VSRGYGTVQFRLLTKLAMPRSGEGWVRVADLVGPSRSEQESARRAVHRLAQQGRVELRHDWRGNPSRRVLYARLAESPIPSVGDVL